ncbi:sensor histidine kinase [Actinopolymorpha pittospori]|uniref:histidine kinase n=1 Tax=Actinopolymorpha pittospori TaxID=648752 RepID=A0A927RLY4_9ACTN|nr:histidine kinase [Actinopolymorpha pittospori]MBE1609661.1 signal transduction histidine kinase [Actinopolymorpha pittospori]
MRRTDLRGWLPDVAVAAVVAFFGLFEISALRSYEGPRPQAFVTLGMSVAAGLCRRFPSAALALLWAMCGVQLLWGIQVMFVQFAVGVVAFGTARWGSAATLWLSGLSIPAATMIVIVDAQVLGRFNGLGHLLSNPILVRGVRELGFTFPVAVASIGMLTLGTPWLAGLAFRFGDRARESRASQMAAEEVAAQAVRDSTQAQEIARLRDEQTRLARDVHDVVGHSLAVILAQAESAQYLDAADPQALKSTMANIATAARSSLRDVRHVLSDTTQPAAVPGGLDKVVDGVRMSGHEVVSTEVGTRRPLPPELEVVAFRVLQEMLTNAIKHGRRDQPVLIERRWEDELRIEVRNAIGEPDALDAAQPIGGQGLEGMRRRLESVGGRLHVRREQEPQRGQGGLGPMFTATAWVPVRAGGR